MTTKPTTRTILAALFGLGLSLACSDRYETTNIPDNASLRLAYDCNKTTLAIGKACAVRPIVTLATKDVAGAEWVVDLLASRRVLAMDSAGVPSAVLRLTTTATGEASAWIVAPVDTGHIVLTLTAHGIAFIDTVIVVNPDLDAGDTPAVASIVLEPTALKLKKGDSLLVRASFFDAGKNKIVGRKAYFSVDSARVARVSSLPADSAWVFGTDTGTTTLFGTRRSVIAKALVTVTP